jgi:formylglycine-generating enzyme required for sulfatase activity
MMLKHGLIVLGILAVATGAGCDRANGTGGNNNNGNNPATDATVDASSDARSDGAPDAAVDAVVDAALPDAALPDAALPDAALPDAALPDAGLDAGVTADASVTCSDNDSDGYGPGCALGEDCDDNASGIIGACQSNGCPQGWVHIPAGAFQMGCNIGELGGDCFSHELPRHTVTLSAYCLQTHEVSVVEYRACQNGGQCTGTPTETGTNSFCNWTPAAASREAHPINCVDWAESQQYCQTWLGGDLPTEAQWEKAARGADPDQRKYPWGDTPLPDCTRCNYDVNGAYAAGAGCGSATTGPATWAVDHLQTSDGDSAFGLKGMAGNVAEWTLDYGSSNFYSECASGCTDPLNTTPGTRREVRGGSYVNSTAEILLLRVVQRSSYTSTVRTGGIGLRCRRTP